MFFKMGYNGLRYEMLGISWLRPYPPLQNLQASTALGEPPKPQYFMTACVCPAWAEHTRPNVYKKFKNTNEL